MVLCTQQDVVDFTQVLFTNVPEDKVTAWIAGATAAIVREVDRPLEREAGRVEKFTAIGLHKVRLDLFPVDVITTVDDDGTVLVEDTDYLIDKKTGILRRVESGDVPRVWTYRGRIDTITVTYTAGVEDGDATNDIPYDLRWATALIVGDIFRSGVVWDASAGASEVALEGIGSMSFPDNPTKVAGLADSAAMTNPQVRNLISPYRKYGVSVGGAVV